MQHLYCFAYAMSQKGIGLRLTQLRNDDLQISKHLDMGWYGKISGAMNIARGTIEWA
jgi:hypothetical protein